MAILGHSGLPGQFWVAHQGPQKEATGAGHKGGGPLSPEAQARGSPPRHLPHDVSEPPENCLVQFLEDAQKSTGDSHCFYSLLEEPSQSPSKLQDRQSQTHRPAAHGHTLCQSSAGWMREEGPGSGFPAHSDCFSSLMLFDQRQTVAIWEAERLQWRGRQAITVQTQGPGSMCDLSPVARALSPSL